MLFVGLRMRDCLPGDKLAINLKKLSFSASDFLATYVFKRSVSTPKALFPRLSTAQIHSLSNTVRGLPTACAADDLELGYNAENGQIEVFDNYVPMPQNFYGLPPKMANEKPQFDQNGFFTISDPVQMELNSSLHSDSYMDELSPQTNVSGHSEHMRLGMPHMNGGSVGRASQPVMDFHNPVFQGGFLPYNNFHMNNNPVHEFTDFKHRTSDVLSCDSSVDSFDSPLDEMFYGSTGSHPATDVSRKRKTSASEVPQYGHDQKNSTAFEFHDTKKMKLENTARTFERPEPPRSFSSQAHFVASEEQLEEKFFSGPEMQNGFADHNKHTSFACTECDAVFKVKSYLTRHSRKHYKANAFVCPFYDESNDGKQFGPGKVGTKCHSTGGFSRKDTYKTHLKALHFIYPPRTKCNERGTTGGRCAGCFEYFGNNVIWFKEHIEAGKCNGFVSQVSQSAVKLEPEA